MGTSNDRFVQVTKGLADGDVVVLNPMSLMSEEEKREAFRNTKDSKKDWGKGEGEPGKGGPAGAAGKGGAPGKGGDPAKAKAKTKKGGRGGNPIFQKVAPADRQKLFRGTDEEKRAILKKAGASDAEIDQTIERMKSFGGGGGFGGGGRGRAGGGPPGGGDQ